MKRWSIGRAISGILLGALLWAAVAGACLVVGSSGGVGFPTHDWPQVRQLLAVRLESVLLASLIGAALAAAGVVYQAILRNPLADPYLLGVSSGASLFAYLWQFSFATAIVGTSGQAFSQQAFAFGGAVLAVGAVFLLASTRGRLEPITLLLTGVIVNAVNGAIFLLINAINKDRPGSGGELRFLVGGIPSTLTDQQKLAAAVLIAAGWLVLLYLSGQFNVAMLGEGEAESLGVRIHRLGWVGLVTSSLVTAAAVAISGPIGFVGLVCPHLARLIVGSDVRRLLPVATALGAALLAVADAFSRYLAGRHEVRTILPVGVLTGLLGGPFFLLLLWQSRRRLAPEGGR